MRPWQERPPEIAALLNPAFCALLLRETVKGYTAEAGTSMPFPLIAFILPIALHAPTRSALPSTTRTKMHVWAQEHPETRLLFAQRARSLLPHAREALLFAASHDLLAFDNSGGIFMKKKKLKAPQWEDESESADCVRAANFVGRWMARVGDIRAVFVMWGVRP